MPIPVSPDYFSAQVVFRGKSGSAQDVYTNTFYFLKKVALTDHADMAEALADQLLTFYTVKDPGIVGGAAISTFLSSAVIETAMEVRVYDLGDPTPRYPIVLSRTLTGMQATAIPSEVTACLSLVAEQNQPRQRGRIYLGPLTNGSIVVANGRAQVADNLRIGALGAARALMNINDHDWVLWSPTDQQFKRFTGAWMDNAFDTQRRRGEEATNRYTIGAYQGQAGTPVPLTP